MSDKLLNISKECIEMYDSYLEIKNCLTSLNRLTDYFTEVYGRYLIDFNYCFILDEKPNRLEIVNDKLNKSYKTTEELVEVVSEFNNNLVEFLSMRELSYELLEYAPEEDKKTDYRPQLKQYNDGILYEIYIDVYTYNKGIIDAIVDDGVKWIEDKEILSHILQYVNIAHEKANTPLELTESEINDILEQGYERD